MARASYIYIIQNWHGGAIVRAFTVKHEMIGWVRAYVRQNPPKFSVIRVPDGRDGARYLYTEKELLEE